jgi:hypothetical protein
MSNLSAYAATLQIHDRLLEVYNHIGHNMPPPEVERVCASLLRVAADLSRALDECAALTSDRAAELSAVGEEAAQAGSAAKVGQDAYAALMRAHGRINRVIIAVMDREPPAGK